MENERDAAGTDDDESLVRTYQADPEGTGGRAAAATLIARWRGRVYLWAFRVLREREASLDVAQDALTQMFMALPRYEARGRFSAWLFTIVHNRCLNAVRQRPLVRDADLDTDELHSPSLGPDGVFESAETERRVLAAMRDALEPVERTAVWLRSFEGMSVDDITRLLQLKGASGARGVLQSARRKLRTALGPAGRNREDRA